MTSSDHELKPKKKIRWKWIFGGAFILLFGACSFALVGGFKNIGIVKPLNKTFITKALSDQLPSVSTGAYSTKSGITDDSLSPLNGMISVLGSPSGIGEPSCSANANASTNEVSGTFVSCSNPVTYSISSATVWTRWRKEGDGWKVIDFNLVVDDFEAYTERVVEKRLKEEVAAKAE